MNHRESIIIDSCFWFSLFEEKDPYHTKAQELVEYLEILNCVIPYSTLYEVLNTRFTKRKDYMYGLQLFMQRPNTIIIDSNDYEENTIDEVYRQLDLFRPMSAVDITIRSIIANDNFRVNYLLTYNLSDFADICAEKGIEILS